MQRDVSRLLAVLTTSLFVILLVNGLLTPVGHPFLAAAQGTLCDLPLLRHPVIKQEIRLILHVVEETLAARRDHVGKKDLLSHHHVCFDDREL